MLNVLKKTTCSSVSVSIVCDHPGHPNRQYNVSSLSSQAVGRMPEGVFHSYTSAASRCHYTISNPIDDHSNISSKKLKKQNFKPLGHYTCMQCGTSHLQTVQENILSRIILATYRKFTVATVTV